MANRRFGGGNPRGQIGRSSFQQANLNPWQGGVAPGNSLDNNIQAQLALALTNLLQPQQQQNNNPPSLLSLNTSPGFMNHQDNFNSQNRFGASRVGRSDFRRSDPYNKNRGAVGGNWRNDRRGGGVSSFKNNPRFVKDKKPDNKRVSDSAKPSDKNTKSIGDTKPKTGDTEIVDISVEEARDEDGNDDTTEQKREWLKEKNNADGESATADNSKGEEDGVGDEKKPRAKDTTKFAGLPSGLLHCFVCDKSMWDGESFQNHIRGKAHKQMLTSLEDSFQIIVNILRENMRLAEEKKMIEFNRMQRNNRKYMHKFQEPESNCNMCDLKFMGKIISHRKTEGHQRLKRFLHPNCDTCNLEFPSRMEWVDHRFAPEHLHKLKEVLDEKNTPEDGYTLAAAESTDDEFELEPLLQENMNTEDENPVFELTDDLANLQNRIPAYSKGRPVSTTSLKPAQGHVCDLCNKFFGSEQSSQEHLKSELHYYNFITAVKDKYKRQASEKAEGDEERAKRAKVEGGAEGTEGTDQEMKPAVGEEVKQAGDEGEGNDMYDPEEACQEEENDEKETTDMKEEKNSQENVADIKEETEDDAAATPVQVEEARTPRRRVATVKNGGTPARAVRGKGRKA